MNDETNSAETNLPNPPPVEPAPSPSSIPPCDRPVTYWIKKLLVCNPFYLASAALLLFGFYRVSMDPNFLAADTAKLTFNFTSLQLYELLLVVTAIILGRRLIWYDSKLLAVLENMLVLVPFILISEAALIERQTVWLFCGVATCFVLGRSLMMQRGVSVFKFPGRLAVIGACVLALNATWPVIYRTLHEAKVGTKLASGPAYQLNELSWLMLLPMLVALANLLPRPHEDGKPLAQRRWFSVGFFSLWTLGTSVHLYSLGYVYDFDLRGELIAPAVWMLAWTLYLQLPRYFETLPPTARKASLILPLLVTFISADATGSNVFPALNALNASAFALIIWIERGNRLAQHLALISLATFIASLPVHVLHPMLGYFDRSKFIGAAALGYFVICCFLSRNPKVAVLGAIAAAIAGGMLRGEHAGPVHWAAQSGFVFFLLHSLRWHDGETRGAVAVRAFIALAWVAQSFVWVRDDAVFWHPLGTATVVLLVFCLRGFIFRLWSPIVVLFAAVLVALCGPTNLGLERLQTTPSGVLAITGSFLLFAAGTVAALTRNRWHQVP